MSESSLSVTFDVLQADIGFKLGYGRDYTLWSSEKVTNVNRVIESGLRRFYFPPPLPGLPVAHDWSFIHIVTTLSATTGNRVFSLPDDFGSIEGDFTWDSAGSTRKIKVIDEQRIREQRQGITLTDGWPLWAAVTSVAPASSKSTRWSVTFERNFDNNYTLQYQYRVLPNTITTGQYPYGGAEHADTIIAACLAAAEWQIDSRAGIEEQIFIERLAASVNRDNRSKPWRQGYNGDSERESNYTPRHIDLIHQTTNLDS